MSGDLVRLKKLPLIFIEEIKVEMIRFKFICSLVLLPTGCLALDDGAIEVEISLSKAISVGRFHDGRLGRLAVHVDRENGHPSYAIFNMHDLLNSEKIVSFAKVSLFESSCAGEPNSIFEYGYFSHGEFVLPQSFSVAKGGCVRVEYHHEDIYGKLNLIDEFHIVIIE